MRIHSVKLENFRGFKLFEQNLSPRLNVFIGKNGSGKTSILDAVSMNINHGIHRLTSNDPSGSFSPEHWMNQDDIHYNEIVCIDSMVYYINDEKSQYLLKINLGSDTFNYDGDKFISSITKIKSSLTKESNLPVIVYFNSEKDYTIDILINIKPNRIPQLNAYFNASNKKSFSFKELTSWFRQQEDIENETRLKEDQSYKDPNLQIIRSAILNFFNNLGNDTYTELSVIRAKPHKSEKFNFNIKSGGELFIKKNNNLLKVNQLSTGEKNVLLTIADIASRIAQLNPSLDNPLQNATGIVLIDEIEAHLHPTWQRKVIRALIKTFPNIQFIISTHSENVIISILDLVKEKELSPSDISVINLKPVENYIESEKLEINVLGQIEGGLSSFYEDQLEDIDQFFNI